MKEKGFIARYDYLKWMENLSDAECGRLYRACLEYGMTGTVPNLRGAEKTLFPMMRQKIDEDAASYKKKCESLRENGKKGGVAKASKCQQKLANAPQMPPINRNRTSDKTDDTPPKGSPPGGRRFNPPSVAEVKAYCKERGNGVDAESFVDFYASKGWKVGKDPMKDWQAAVRTWERRQRDGKHASSARREEPGRVGGVGEKPKIVLDNEFTRLYDSLPDVFGHGLGEGNPGWRGAHEEMPLPD